MLLTADLKFKVAAQYMEQFVFRVMNVRRWRVPGRGPMLEETHRVAAEGVRHVNRYQGIQEPELLNGRWCHAGLR